MLKSQSFSSSFGEEDFMNLHGWFDSVLMAGVQTVACQPWSGRTRREKGVSFGRLLLPEKSWCTLEVVLFSW